MKQEASPNADAIHIRGARQNNLKNLTLSIPNGELVVVHDSAYDLDDIVAVLKAYNPIEAQDAEKGRRILSVLRGLFLQYDPNDPATRIDASQKFHNWSPEATIRFKPFSLSCHAASRGSSARTCSI